MKKIIIVPDSFKGTLSSKQICDIMKKKISAHFSEAEVISIPVADGGEGSVDCFLNAVGGELIQCACVNPFFEEMQGFYGILNKGGTAIIEMASCAGLPLVEDRKNPMLATTYGVGLLIQDALQKGVREIILGLGGSATNDFGCGAAAALGVRFHDAQGELFIPTGGTLCDVEKIDIDGVDRSFRDIKFTIMCDVQNPVYGKNGAAYVYAPQKGASQEMVATLDKGLRHICDVVQRNLKIEVSDLIGGGAAGAMAGGMYAFFNAAIRSGIDTVLDAVCFDNILQDADIVFTGEGKIDAQSLQGKVIAGVAKRARAKSVPVVAIVGGIEGNIAPIYELGVNSVFTINRLPEDFSISRYKSEENLSEAMDNVLRILKI